MKLLFIAIIIIKKAFQRQILLSVISTPLKWSKSSVLENVFVPYGAWQSTVLLTANKKKILGIVINQTAA